MTSNVAQSLGDVDEATDVTHSTAYNVLGTLVDEGMILEERAEYLRQKFKNLHTRVLTIYKRDNLLLKRARQLRAELDKERERVQSRGEVAKKDDEEIQKLKRTLISLEKELNEAQERESILTVETLEYNRRKQNLILEREDAQAAEEARLRPKIESTQADINDMGVRTKELIELQGELLKELDTALQEEAQCRSAISNFAASVGQARQQLVNVENEPDRARKQFELVVRSLGAAQKELNVAEEKVDAQAEVIQDLQQEKLTRSADVAAAQAGLQKVKNDIEAKRKTLAALNTSFEMELETRQGFQERLYELEQLAKTTKISCMQEEDGVERMLREKAKCLKEFGAVEQVTKDLAKEQQTLRERIAFIEKGMAQNEAARKQVRAKIEEAKKKVEVRARQLLREQSKEKQFTADANILLEDIDDVSARVTERAMQEEVKRRELVALVSRRQDMNREVAREASRVLLAKNEVITKTQELQEIRHRHRELERRLKALLDTFQNVKRERSQKTALIQAITQKMTEVNEKTKILENELEVLVREYAVKEQELVKKKRLTHEAQQAVAKLRLEKNKQRKKVEVAMDAEKDVRSQVRRMNLDVAAREEELMRFRTEYVSAIESRNKTGIQLIDRNDTTSLLVEKVKAQEVAIEQGTRLTNARSEEVKRLKIRLGDLLRGIEVCQKSIPKVKQLESELEAIAASLEDERWRMEVLENELTDPNNARRWRYLEPHKKKEDAIGGGGAAAAATAAATAAAAEGGMAAHSDVPSAEYVRLQARTQEMEARLDAINQRLREKELILAEVRELSTRVGAQAASGKDYTLALARQMNGYQSGIRAKTRQMMAAISELSLFQATSAQLQQEVERLEEVVAEAEARLQDGNAPFVEAQEEYLRQKASKERYVEAIRRRKEEARQEALVGPNTVITTAEPRANAYVPDEGLGLPRPFGALAPFKPTVTHAQKTGRFVAASSGGAGGGHVAAVMSSSPATQQHQQPPQRRNVDGAAAASLDFEGTGVGFSSSMPYSGRMRGAKERDVTTPVTAPASAEQQRLSQRNFSATQ